MKLSPLFQYAGISAFFVTASLAVMEARDMPGGSKLSERLDRYQEGGLLLHAPGYREGATDQCIVEKPESKITYEFGKSTAIFSTQFLFGGQELQSIPLGSIPDFKVVNIECDKLNVEGRKWDTLEQYKAATQDEINQMSEKLKVIANQEDVTRFSAAFAVSKPR